MHSERERQGSWGSNREGIELVSTGKSFAGDDQRTYSVWRPHLRLCLHYLPHLHLLKLTWMPIMPDTVAGRPGMLPELFGTRFNPIFSRLLLMPWFSTCTHKDHQPRTTGRLGPAMVVYTSCREHEQGVHAATGRRTQEPAWMCIT